MTTNVTILNDGWHHNINVRRNDGSGPIEVVPNRFATISIWDGVGLIIEEGTEVKHDKVVT